MKKIDYIICNECGARCTADEEMFSWDYGKYTGLVCEDCFDAMFDELTRNEKAHLIGSEVRTVEEILYDV